MQEVAYTGHVPHLIDERLYRPATRLALAGAARARRLQSGRLGVYVFYLLGLVVVLLGAARLGARMSGATAAAGAVQLVGGLVLAPLLPGLVQHWKRGCRAVAVRRRSALPRAAPAVGQERSPSKGRRSSTGSPSRGRRGVAAAVLSSRSRSLAPALGVGHDALALLGLLALARFALAAASWDVANGFSLMGASRDLTISVFVEATLVLSLAVSALVAGTTDLRGVIAGTAGTEVWTSPALALAAVAFALVVVAETGRQPVDNPDTHLELTMIHEGPLLEYAGPRPRLPAVGGVCAPLACARARGAGVPASSGRVWRQLAWLPSCSSSCARRSP